MGYSNEIPPEDGFYEAVYVGEGADNVPEIVRIVPGGYLPQESLGKDGSFDWEKSERLAGEEEAEAIRDGKELPRRSALRFGCGRPWDPAEFLWGERIPIRVAPDLSRFYAVWRQDDNGNKFRMGSGPKGEMEDLLREYESRGHKQTYWMEPCGADGAGLKRDIIAAEEGASQDDVLR